MDTMQWTIEERLNEVGAEPPCPFCQRARVLRSDYIRCNPCGINWIQGEDIESDPRVERWSALMEKLTAFTRLGKGSTAKTAESSSEGA
jgi:ribosomal protein L37AE/L43A